MDEISYSGTPAPKRRISKRALTFGALAVVVLLLVLGLVFFITRKSSTPDETSISLPPTSTPEATQEVSPTGNLSGTPSKAPTKAPSKTPTKAPTGTSSTANSTSVAVENGSGESGVAAKASDALKAAGYTIASTGNADNFNYTGVTIQAKSAAVASQLKSDLASAGYTITSATSDLSSGQSYDALVIVGK